MFSFTIGQAVTWTGNRNGRRMAMRGRITEIPCDSDYAEIRDFFGQVWCVMLADLRAI